MSKEKEIYLINSGSEPDDGDIAFSSEDDARMYLDEFCSNHYGITNIFVDFDHAMRILHKIKKYRKEKKAMFFVQVKDYVTAIETTILDPFNKVLSFRKLDSRFLQENEFMVDTNDDSGGWLQGFSPVNEECAKVYFISSEEEKWKKMGLIYEKLKEKKLLLDKEPEKDLIQQALEKDPSLKSKYSIVLRKRRNDEL